MAYAGLGKRFIAFFIDGLLFGALYVGIGLFGVELLTPVMVEAALVVIVLAFFAYFVYFEGSSGQTLGKRFTDIRVVDEAGNPIGYGPAAVRNVLRVIDGMFGYLVGALVIVFSDKNQRIGDIAGNTIVIVEPAGQRPDTQPQTGNRQGLQQGQNPQR